MLRKLSFFILLTVSASAVAVAQQAPESNNKTEKTFNFTFENSGSYLGVQTQEISKENFAKYGLREVRGVAVEKVVENSPAAIAGLQNGDVIVKFNGEEITGTRKLTRLVNESAPDHQVNLTVLRNGDERQLSVTLGKREMPKFESGGLNFGNFSQMPQVPMIQRTPRAMIAPFPSMPGSPADSFVWQNGENRQIGIGVTNLTKQLGDYFGITGGKGLLIETIRENSPAAKAGIKAGDVIIEVEGKEIKNSLDLIRTINEKKEGDVNLTIIRDKNRQQIRVTPEAGKGTLIPMFDNSEGNLPEMNFTFETPTAPTAPIAPKALTAPRVL